MKRFIAILFMVSVLSGCGLVHYYYAYSERGDDSHGNYEQLSRDYHKYDYYGPARKDYVVVGPHVMYDGRIIPEADARYFKNLGWGYAKDAYNVFFCGIRLQGVSAVSSFKTIKDGYARSQYDVFYMGQKLHGAMPASFRLLDDGYARDQHSVFYCGEKLHQANVASFRVLRDGYASDRFCVYFRGKIIKRL